MPKLTQQECAGLGVHSIHCGSDFNEFHQKQMKTSQHKMESQILQLQKKVGKLIAKKRQEQNISQEELAMRVGTKQAVISRIENGTVSVGLRMLHRIAYAMGVEIDIVMK